jgi:hypothetical protein
VQVRGLRHIVTKPLPPIGLDIWGAPIEGGPRAQEPTRTTQAHDTRFTQRGRPNLTGTSPTRAGDEWPHGLATYLPRRTVFR